MNASGAPAELLDLELLARQPSGAALARVTAAPDGALIAVGTHVLIGPADPCGECEVCRRGGPAVCVNAVVRDPQGSTARVSSRWVVALGDGFEPLAQLGAAAAKIANGELCLAMEQVKLGQADDLGGGVFKKRRRMQK